MNCKPKKPIRRKAKPKKSRVLWRSGRVIKKGSDYIALKREVFERSGGYCENPECRTRIFWPVEPHHIKFRSHGGSDTAENLICLCRPCHEKEHNR